jgi:hypothetical protein
MTTCTKLINLRQKMHETSDPEEKAKLYNYSHKNEIIATALIKADNIISNFNLTPELKQTVTHHINIADNLLKSEEAILKANNSNKSEDIAKHLALANEHENKAINFLNEIHAITNSPKKINIEEITNIENIDGNVQSLNHNNAQGSIQEPELPHRIEPVRGFYKEHTLMPNKENNIINIADETGPVVGFNEYQILSDLYSNPKIDIIIPSCNIVNQSSNDSLIATPNPSNVAGYDDSNTFSTI